MHGATIRELPQVSDVRADIKDEIAKLHDLIAVTEFQLKEQQALEKRLLDYEALQQRYLHDPDNNELLFLMVKSAFRLKKTINALHLDHAFTDSFIKELSAFSEIAAKRGIPKS